MTPAYSPGETVQTLRGVRLRIVRIDRQPHATHYWLAGVPWPYTESQLRPLPPEPKETPPMSAREYGRMARGKR